MSPPPKDLLVTAPRPPGRKPYDPEHLENDFGSTSPVARDGIGTLYRAIVGADNPRAKLLFEKWKTSFADACGYEIAPSGKVDKLAAFYALEGAPQPAALLFAVQTYYAILVKLLASDIVSFFHPSMTPEIVRLQYAATSGQLKREMEELERTGGILEGDPFSWYLSAWSDHIDAVLHELIARLANYNPATLSENSGQSRDLLKALYQQLFPKSLRHDLGEYYTPDWLADHTLNALGCDGHPDRRLLDPACGSGTFLVMAINRVRRWYNSHRHECVYGERELLARILSNIVGFDLNPLAVMAARTNYLVAINDLLHHASHVEIPVYLCDSVAAPFTGAAGVPLSMGRFDYIAGNPPWVNYENLPQDYRQATASIWKRYKLFPEGGWRARFAKGNTELAMVFTYTCADNYLAPDGRLGFVITPSVFQSKEAGRGFRAFSLDSTRKLEIEHVDDFTALRPFEGALNRTAVFVCRVSPAGTRYPVPYTSWLPKRGAAVEGASTPVELSACPVADPLSPWMLLPPGVSKATVDKLTSGQQHYRAWKGADTRGGNGIFWLHLLGEKPGLVMARNTPEFSRKKPPETPWGFEPDVIYPLLRGRETGRWHTAPRHALLYPHEGDHAIPESELERKWPQTFGYLKEMEPHLRERRMYDLSFRSLPFYSLFETGAFLLAPYKVVWKYVARELTCAVQGPVKYDLLPNTTCIPDHKLVIVPCHTEAEAHYVCALLNSAPARLVAQTYIVGTQISTHILEYIKVPPFDPENATHAHLADLGRRCHAAAGAVRRGGGEAPSRMNPALQHRAATPGIAPAAQTADALPGLESEIDLAAAAVWGLDPAELRALQDAFPAHAGAPATAIDQDSAPAAGRHRTPAPPAFPTLRPFPALPEPT